MATKKRTPDLIGGHVVHRRTEGDCMGLLLDTVTLHVANGGQIVAKPQERTNGDGDSSTLRSAQPLADPHTPRRSREKTSEDLKLECRKNLRKPDIAADEKSAIVIKKSAVNPPIGQSRVQRRAAKRSKPVPKAQRNATVLRWRWPRTV